MIAVIADDLTGAAEMGGIGLTYGLAVELAMSVTPQSAVDLLVIATDARSVSEPAAVLEMTQASKAVIAMKPKWMYKKIDSVLRGHVIAETRAQLPIFAAQKALLVPANPALGRTLVNGHYYVHGQLIHQTHFSEDPEFPVTDSDVLKRLNTANIDLFVKSHQDKLPEHGIVIGEVKTQSDLQAWADRIDNQTLLGGGAGFFTAILESLYLKKQENPVPLALGNYRLYVCGTAFGDSVSLVKKAVNTGQSVHYMPKVLTQSDSLGMSELSNWAAEIATSIRQAKQVILAIDPASVENGDAVHLRTIMAMAVKQVLNQISIDELIIEGGSTASAILREISVTRLVPTHELATGVVRSLAIEKTECRPNDLHITVKPGSYRWPPELWTF